MGTVRDLEFIFHDAETNSTVVLHGELDTALITNHTKTKPLFNSTSEDTEYDGPGALYYVISVIIVYSIAMFLIVATLLRRKSHNKNIDVEVDKYIKGLENARNQAKMESVLRTRLRWPGNYIGLRFSSRHPCSPPGSTGKPMSDDSSVSMEESGSVDDDLDKSYEELPATTKVDLYHINPDSTNGHSRYVQISDSKPDTRVQRKYSNLNHSASILPSRDRVFENDPTYEFNNIDSAPVHSNGILSLHDVSRVRRNSPENVLEMTIPDINKPHKSNNINQKQSSMSDHIAYTALDTDESDTFSDDEQRRIQEYQNKRRRSGAIPKLPVQSGQSCHPLSQIDEHYV